jgi:hypothetical protein
MPGRILLRTTPDGSQAPVDAVKIDSAQNVTVSAGNLVIGTSGKGIDFSATPGTGTSELLDDYEEGTWTPTGNNITFAAGTTGKYTKVGNLVTVTFTLNFPTTADTSTANIGGFPFVAAQYSSLSLQGNTSVSNAFLNSGADFATFINTTNTAYLTNANLSTQSFFGFASYQV